MKKPRFTVTWEIDLEDYEVDEVAESLCLPLTISAALEAERTMRDSSAAAPFFIVYDRKARKRVLVDTEREVSWPVDAQGNVIY